MNKVFLEFDGAGGGKISVALDSIFAVDGSVDPVCIYMAGHSIDTCQTTESYDAVMKKIRQYTLILK